jgi:hypothetical protein
MSRLECKPPHVNQLKMANNMLIILNSHSSFALVISCVEVRSFFCFSTMPTRVASGRSKPMRVGHRTGILRLRVLMDGILFEDKKMFRTMRETTFGSSELSFEASFGFKQSFVYIKPEHKL